MRTNIEIDDALMAQAQRASGHATKKQTVEQALRLMIRLRRQQEVDVAFANTAGAAIGALVTISVRRIKLAMASGCPYKAVFATAHRALCAAVDTS